MGALTLPLNTILANLDAESCLQVLLSPHHQEHSAPGKGQVQLMCFDHSQSIVCLHLYAVLPLHLTEIFSTYGLVHEAAGSPHSCSISVDANNF